MNPAHPVIASSFADPKDVAAFRRAKAAGLSDRAAFAVGDNAVGMWGDSTAQGTGPSCALPPEDWHDGKHGRGSKVLVKGNGKQIVCALKDTMPHRDNIKNGCGIDLNPDAVAALGWAPPLMRAVTWEWAA